MEQNRNVSAIEMRYTTQGVGYTPQKREMEEVDEQRGKK